MLARTKQILVVDSDEAEARDLTSQLSSRGYSSTTTWSGLEALGLVTSQTFDLVVVSNYLPDLYVGDFLERFGQMPGRPKAIVMPEKQGVRNENLTTIVQMIEEKIEAQEPDTPRNYPGDSGGKK